ncbi:MAG: universal stress protein [Acidobacteria bacterium]|nr:universal stress protein [Acidobacteriota bacterium]
MRVQFCKGIPKKVIVDEAEKWGADLIVLGLHGTTVIERFLIGSASLAVATPAPCSVEIVGSHFASKRQCAVKAKSRSA